jgi:hypothetical protein
LDKLKPIRKPFQYVFQVKAQLRSPGQVLHIDILRNGSPRVTKCQVDELFLKTRVFLIQENIISRAAKKLPLWMKEGMS